MLIRASARAVFQKRFAVIYTDVQLSPATAPSGKVRGAEGPTGFKSKPSELSRPRDHGGDGNARNVGISHL